MRSNMQRIIVIAIVGLLGLFHHSVNAIVPEEDGLKICQAWINEPTKFHELQASACEVKEEDAYGDTFYNTSTAYCFDFVNKRYAVGFTGGSCSSSCLAEIDGNGYPLAGDSKFPCYPNNVEYDGFTMGLDAKPLEYNGEVFSELHSYWGARYLMHYASGNILCGAVYGFEGWQEVEPVNNDVSKKFAAAEYQNLSIAVEKDDAEQQVCPAVWGTYTAGSDLNRDGVKEVITTYSFASGAGCGCDGQYLGVNEYNGCSRDSGDADGFEAVLLKFTKDNSDCSANVAWSVVAIAGKDYLLKDVSPDALEANEDGSRYSYSKPLSRVLYEFDKDRFVPVCSTEPKFSKHIDSAVMMSVGYQPLFSTE